MSFSPKSQADAVLSPLLAGDSDPHGTSVSDLSYILMFGGWLESPAQRARFPSPSLLLYRESVDHRPVQDVSNANDRSFSRPPGSVAIQQGVSLLQAGLHQVSRVSAHTLSW